MNLRKHAPDYYRIGEGYYFGQIIKDGRQWNAEIRRSHDGALMRYAGIWTTRKEAVEECEFLLSQPVWN